MEILKDLIKEIKPCKIKKVIIGTFTTAVISKQCGLSSTIREQCGEGGHSRVHNLGEMAGMEVKELAQFVMSDNLLEASIGMAAINSALQIEGCEFTEINASEIIAKKGKDKRVAVIGHFPFLGKLKNQVGELLVFELRLRPGDISSAQIPALLPDADVVAISGTTLINHTFDEIMSFCKPSAYKIMLGPSTPLSPVLFNYGIDVISGTIVEDAELLLGYLTQGATFQQLKGKKLVTLEKR